MNAYSHSGGSSAVASVADLDGYSLDNYNVAMNTTYGAADHEHFGFDPPEYSRPSKLNTPYSPPEVLDSLSLSNWPDFGQESALDENIIPSKPASFQYDSNLFEMDKRISQALSTTSAAIARYGQVTPPRSNSANSSMDAGKSEAGQSIEPVVPERRRRNTKNTVKQAEAEADMDATSPPTSSRKRKHSKKTSARVVSESNTTIEEAKRRQSLEKNRLAAAKCRVNKKEKTEQLQRDSHDKAVHNAFLKEQVMRMKEEVQQMNAILLAHANCDGCKSPEEIRTHLNHMSNEFFAHHLGMAGAGYGDYSQMPVPDMSQLHSNHLMAEDFFPGTGNNDHSILNPPLPDLTRSSEYETLSPMQTD